MSYLHFDGTDDLVEIPFCQNPSSGSWTWVLVFRATGTPDPGLLGDYRGGILCQNGPFPADPQRWLQHQTVPGGHELRSPLPHAAEPLTIGNISLNTWYMAVLLRSHSPASLRGMLLRTGQTQVSAAYTGTIGGATGEHFLGFNGPAFNPGFEGWWPGDVAWMQHYDRRLGDTEVTGPLFEGVKAILAGRGISL